MLFEEGDAVKSGEKGKSARASSSGEGVASLMESSVTLHALSSSE